MRNKEEFDGALKACIAMFEFKQSPIKLTLSLISKKWAIEIITSLMKGRRRFSDFLEANPDVSGKMLAERLKELHKAGFIEKIVINMIPLRVKYQITTRGRMLGRVLYEMAIFGSAVFAKEVFTTPPENPARITEWFAKIYGIEVSPESKTNDYRNLLYY